MEVVVIKLTALSLFAQTLLTFLFTMTLVSEPQDVLTHALSMSSQDRGHQHHIVLIGGGHAHAQVIRALNSKSRPNNVSVTLIDMTESASYSGMVPGCVAKIYTPAETLLRLRPLCKWADIDFIQDEVVDIDLDQQKIMLRKEQNPVAYDLLSLDIGSRSRGLEDTPGAWKYSIPTRPISKLVDRIQNAEDSLGSSAHVVVVGGGAAGIELAMSIRGRWNPILGDENLKVTLLDAGDKLVPNETAPCRAALQQALDSRRIGVIHNVHVQEMTETCIVLDNGADLDYTHCIWATGAAAHDLAATNLESRGMAVSDRGWIRVNSNLQSLSHPNVFAAGDCCTIENGNLKSPPKAGVYAVRTGPILVENLTAFLQSKALSSYIPQDDFLKLLALGDGTALGFRFGIPINGKWVFELKDHIDQMFMDLFKQENLPSLEDSSEYDVAQFDSAADVETERLGIEEASQLLQQSDATVDYLEAWSVLRAMAKDEDYRKQVLEHVHKTSLVVEQQ